MDKDSPSGAAEASLEKLKQESQALKERIEELRRKTEMPLNSSLGDPAIDADNADGHNDVPDEEED
jgi:cell division protein FtsB